MDAAEILVVTADPSLRDDALRWAAALGVTPGVVADPVDARRSWVAASAVVVGEDLAPRLAATAVPRRDHVLVVGPGARDEGPVWPHAVALGAVAVLDSSDESTILTRLGQAVDGRSDACVLGVVGAVGGAGASSLAAVVATEADRRGLQALLLDADATSGGLDLLLGAEEQEGLRWSSLEGAGGHVGADRLARGLPRAGDVAVLTRDRERSQIPTQVVPDVLSAASRAFDVVVADVPRHLDELGAHVLGRCAGVVLVVPEDVRGVAAARMLLPQIQRHVPLVALVTVRRRRGLGPDPVVDALRLPVVARLRHDRSMPGSVEHALGPARSRPLRSAARAVLDLLGLTGAT